MPAALRSPWSPLPLLLAAALPAQRELQARVDRALDQSRPALLWHLRQAVANDARCGEVGLLCLAALHDGVDPAQAALGAALARLLEFEAASLQTYDLALRLLVLEAWDGAPGRARVAAEDCRQLLRHQSDGGFAYTAGNGGRWDLSNTQYAALGLRAASALGVVVDRKVWESLAEAVTAVQTSYGGFSYRRADEPEPYPSMTVAGIAVLAICRQALDGKGRAPAALDKHIRRGWQWMDRNVAAIGDRAANWSYYFHYGLERAAILTDVDEVAGEDWFARGARMLVDDQLHGGGWHQGPRPAGEAKGRGDAVSTCFAVLFLRRKFQKVAGPLTPRPVTLAQLTEQSVGADVEACAEGLIRRGRPAMPEILRALLGDLPPRRKAAAIALRGIAGDDFGFDPGQDAEHNRDAIRKAELWHLKNR